VLPPRQSIKPCVEHGKNNAIVTPGPSAHALDQKAGGLRLRKDDRFTPLGL
jgi:hypothetical protein